MLNSQARIGREVAFSEGLLHLFSLVRPLDAASEYNSPSIQRIAWSKIIKRYVVAIVQEITVVVIKSTVLSLSYLKELDKR